jgi:hypothetical protein
LARIEIAFRANRVQNKTPRRPGVAGRRGEMSLRAAPWYQVSLKALRPIIEAQIGLAFQADQRLEKRETKELGVFVESEAGWEAACVPETAAA